MSEDSADGLVLQPGIMILKARHQGQFLLSVRYHQRPLLYLQRPCSLPLLDLRLRRRPHQLPLRYPP